MMDGVESDNAGAITAPAISGRATDAEIARLRSRIGDQVSVSELPYLTEVTRDSIRHWAWATGDRNPLYLDEAYAKASVHRSMIAPPTMLYAFDRLSIGYRGGLPGVHSMFAGSSWHWRRAIRVGEQIRARVTFKDLVELPSRFAGRMFKQLSLVEFLTPDDEEVASVEAWGMRTERSVAKGRGKYDHLELKTYDAAELTAIANEYAAESCRSDRPLFWEEIVEGSSIPGVVRGPYSATTAVAFEQAWGGLFIRAHGYWFDFLNRHPAIAILNDQGVPEPPEAVHWDSALARSAGVPAAYDYGPERISWIATMLTNWCGNDGLLERLHCEIRRFNVIGDLTRCGGRVISKSSGTDDRGRVDLEVWAQDQRGETTAKGSATVLLPMSHGT
jgi:acyl dehydratase